MNIRYNRVNMVTYKMDQIECIKQMGVYFNASFRWFKFTLKPPYSITHGKLQLAIWDTSFWTFLVKFGHKLP